MVELKRPDASNSRSSITNLTSGDKEVEHNQECLHMATAMVSVLADVSRVWRAVVTALLRSCEAIAT